MATAVVVSYSRAVCDEEGTCFLRSGFEILLIGQHLQSGDKAAAAQNHETCSQKLIRR